MYKIYELFEYAPINAPLSVLQHALFSLVCHIHKSNGPMLAELRALWFYYDKGLMVEFGRRSNRKQICRRLGYHRSFLKSDWAIEILLNSLSSSSFR